MFGFFYVCVKPLAIMLVLSYHARFLPRYSLGSAMQLQVIDKAVYRQRLMRIQIAIVAFLATVALSSSAVMIALFSTPDGDNFWLNFAGVALAAVLVGLILKNKRQHPYLAEANYVWTLKQELNAIYRKHMKVEAGVKAGNELAMQIQYFNLIAAKQVYQLDNNTVTLEDLEQRLAALLAQAAQENMVLDETLYQREQLAELV